MMTKEGSGFNGSTPSAGDNRGCLPRGFDSHSGSGQSVRPMKSRYWFIVLVLALGACGSRAPVTGDSVVDGDEQWVCRPDGDAWDCDRATDQEPPTAPDAE